MRYNTLVCDILEIKRESNGDYRLKGVVNHVAGEDYIPGQSLAVSVKGDKGDYLGGVNAGTFLLEKVDPESGYCAFPTLIKAGKSADPALIGPLQVGWKDASGKYHNVTLDKAGLEGDALDQAGRASKQCADSLRVSRNLILLDDDHEILGRRVVPNAEWQKAVREMIADNPQMKSIIIRDGQAASMRHLRWDDKSQQYTFTPPERKDGSPILFKGDQVELIPVRQFEYLSNRFDPKKSTAVSEITQQLAKSDRQLAFDAKLFPSGQNFASGMVVFRNLPQGGHTLERIAASFPSQHFKSIPGELRILENRPDHVNAVDALQKLMSSLGVPKEEVARVLSSIQKNTAPTHATESAMANDPRPGLPQAGFIENTQQAARQAQAVLKQGAGAAPVAAAPVAPAARSSVEPKPAAQVTPPAPAPQGQDTPPPPRVSFGRRR